MYSWNGADVAVVDADSHVVEPPGAWDAYISKAYRDRVPRLVRDEGTDWLYLEGERFFSYGMVRGLVAGDSGFPDAQGPAAEGSALCRVDPAILAILRCGRSLTCQCAWNAASSRPSTATARSSFPSPC